MFYKNCIDTENVLSFSSPNLVNSLKCEKEKHNYFSQQADLFYEQKTAS